MLKICAILIEADPSCTLGGSCTRDVINMANHLMLLDSILDSETDIELLELHILSSYEISNKSKYSSKCSFGLNTLQNMKSIVRNLPNPDILLVYISGHGYQIKDRNSNKIDEIDGLDEYINTKSGIILDDTLKDIFVSNLPPHIKFIGITDTCHSGSMFDLDYTLINNEFIKSTKLKPAYIKAISIGACADNQLEVCDIGQKIGYGGLLTIQLIENDLIRDIISYDRSKLINVHNKLDRTMRLVRETITIQTSDTDLI